MKKLADISSFERLGGQDTASADVSVFNFETTFTVTADSEEGRALLAPLGATEAQFRADITSASQLDKVLRWTGSEGYRQISSEPNFDLEVFFDYVRMFYDDNGETSPIDEFVDGLYYQPVGGLQESLGL